MSKNNSNIPAIYVIGAIIILLIIYLFSLGKINSADVKSPKEFKDDILQAKRRHQKLLDLLVKQKELKAKLDKKFKRIYFGVRCGLVLGWIIGMAVLYYFHVIKDLSDFLNYSEISILFLITINFLTFGTITNLKNYLDLLKTKTENWVYGKYVDLDEKIESNLTELEQLENRIDNNNLLN